MQYVTYNELFALMMLIATAVNIFTNVIIAIISYKKK